MRDQCRVELTTLERWVTRFWPKVGQIDPKWDKSGDFFQIRFNTFGSIPKWNKSGDFFQIRFSTFGAPAPNVLNLIWKNPRICPIWDQFDPLWVKIWSAIQASPWTESVETGDDWCIWTFPWYNKADHVIWLGSVYFDCPYRRCQCWPLIDGL